MSCRDKTTYSTSSGDGANRNRARVSSKVSVFSSRASIAVFIPVGSILIFDNNIPNQSLVSLLVVIVDVLLTNIIGSFQINK
jgi:hypothetical protein